MAITHAATVRNTFANAVLTALNAGAGPAKLEVRTAGGTTLLATVTLGDPAGTVSGATLTFSGLPASDTSIDATGTAAIVQFKDSDDTLVAQGTISENGGGGDLQLASSDPASLDFVAGNTFTLSSATYTAPV